MCVCAAAPRRFALLRKYYLFRLTACFPLTGQPPYARARDSSQSVSSGALGVLVRASACTRTRLNPVITAFKARAHKSHRPRCTRRNVLAPWLRGSTGAWLNIER